jgi:hypothetical protein
MENSLGEVEEAVAQDIASRLVRESEIAVMLSIVSELARRMDYPGLVARCSRSSFEIECRNIVGRMLLNVGRGNPRLVKAVVARLHEMHMGPEDGHRNISL